MELSINDYVTGLSVLAMGIISFYNTKFESKKNTEDVKKIYKDVEGIGDRLIKIAEKQSDCTEFKIKVTEALDRTYLKSEKAYETFVETKDYKSEMLRIEKEMLRTDKNIEKHICSMKDANKATMEFLHKIFENTKN